MAAASVAAATMPSTATSKKHGSSGQAGDKKYAHRLNHKQQISPELRTATQLAHSAELSQRQIERACMLALHAVGFDGADKLAMDSFAGLVQEYMNHFLRSVIKSMQGSRRRTAVPIDFQFALVEHNLTLSSLLPHLDPPVVGTRTPTASARKPLLSSRSEILPPLAAETASASSFSGAIDPTTDTISTFSSSNSSSASLDDTTRTKQEAILNKLLDSSKSGTSQPTMNGMDPETTSSSSSSLSSLSQPINVPHGFPALPSQHTYRSQAVFASRERDPQKIRERATEEGRLGEEALRRLAAKQAELRRIREEREERERTQQQQQQAALELSSTAAVAPSTGPTGRKRKTAIHDSAAPAAAAAATASSSSTTASLASKAARLSATTAARNPASVFRTRADDMFRSLMAGIGTGEDAGAGGDGAGVGAGDERGGQTSGVDVGIAAATTTRDGDWNGGMNEPVNAERIYWRQAPKRSSAANG